MLGVSGLKIRCAIIASFALTSVAFGAFAETCAIEDITDADNASVAAENSIKCLLTRIQNLETELAPFRNAKGAVLAFDRSGATTVGESSAGYCPDGWEWFEPAGGRMVVGAGQHQNLDENGERLTRYPSHLEIPEEALGGAEEHTLIPGEMPRHDHDLFYLTIRGEKLQFVDAQEGTNAPYFSKSSHKLGISRNGTHTTGGSRPHNNMPPYIALYFCKKEAG